MSREEVVVVDLAREIHFYQPTESPLLDLIESRNGLKMITRSWWRPAFRDPDTGRFRAGSWQTYTLFRWADGQPHEVLSR